jgi:hypothetical protein
MRYIVTAIATSDAAGIDRESMQVVKQQKGCGDGPIHPWFPRDSGM